MGSKISTDGPRRNSFISIDRDPAGDTSLKVSLLSDITQAEVSENLEISKGRVGVRQKENGMAHSSAVLQESFSNTMDINLLPFPTIICDTENQIVAVNSSFYELTGLSETESAGKHLSDIIQESKHEEVLPQKEYFLSTGKNTWQAEMYINTSSNTTKYVLLKSRLIKGTAGIPNQILIQLVDLSHKKEAEDQLRKKSDELEKFVFSTSHDLRAPLRSILGLLYIIQQEPNQDAIKTYLDMIRSSVNRMDNFIKEIVDLSRNSRQPINKVEIDLKKIVTEIFDSLRFIPGAEKIDFILNIKQSRPFVSDISRIKIVLNNLISNAIAYHRMQQENPFIEVNINITNKYCYIDVMDNGRGIQKEHQTRIFDMFYRASDDAKGSGLGLYIVKEAVHKLNGEIRIKSTWGEGTTFSLKFFNHDFQ